MANAGKILLMPKGEYDSETTYSTLDWVRYGGKAWVCKQNSTGNTPAENTYWTELCADGIDGDDGESYYMYIRYSENSDGTDFVSTPTVDTVYIGFYTGNSNTAPANKALYTWSKYVGSGGGGTGAWGDITGKPFNSVGNDGLKVTSDVLDVDLTKVQAILNDATTSVSGKMSATDKAKLDGIATGANNYSLPTASSAKKGGAKISGTDGLTMDGDTLKAAVKGLIASENDFNAQTESTSQAIDSYLAKKIITDIAGSGIAHNSIYRGKNLGTTVTAAQYAAISAGTFEDLYIGDYWTIGGINYRIAAFDYYWNCGDTPLIAHHAVIVPEKNLYDAAMNGTTTTTGGYVGSQMYTTNLAQAKTTIKAAFSGHVVNHRIYLINAVANGYSSGGVWVDSEVDLMNEQMVYGSGIFSPVSTGSAVPVNHRVERNQLPLFAMNPAMLNTQENYWLRDVISASYFALVADTGFAFYGSASRSAGVRPAFCIS